MSLSVPDQQAVEGEPLSVSRFDALMAGASEVFQQVDAPVEHDWIKNFYVRRISMFAGSLVFSKRHRTRHPYVITQGAVSVWTEREGVQHLQAPFTGITEPGTERILYIHEDTIWTTFHPREPHETTEAQIEARIIEPHENPLLAMSPEEREALVIRLQERGAE